MGVGLSRKVGRDNIYLVSLRPKNGFNPNPWIQPRFDPNGPLVCINRNLSSQPQFSFFFFAARGPCDLLVAPIATRDSRCRARHSATAGHSLSLPIGRLQVGQEYLNLTQKITLFEQIVKTKSQEAEKAICLGSVFQWWLVTLFRAPLPTSITKGNPFSFSLLAFSTELGSW